MSQLLALIHEAKELVVEITLLLATAIGCYEFIKYKAQK
jgi:hypothetical protein